jgi:DNA-directed RNA polymerase subunit H (RpoH/RPB5)
MSEIEIIRTNVREMLETRGDDVSFIEEHGDAVEESRYYNEAIVLETDRTGVIFALTKEILREWKQEDESYKVMIEKYKMQNFIIILSEPPSSVMMHFLQLQDKELQALGGIFQVFYKSELMHNPMNHVLTPLHEKITKDEATKVMEEYKIKNTSQMPLILKTDKIARWLGLKHGDIVRITRYNNTSGTYYYYRCCM